MIEIADDPRYRAVVGIENTTASQWLSPPDQVSVPSKGEIPVDFCLDSTFPYTTNMSYTHLMWRLVEPTRQQDDFGLLNGLQYLGKCRVLKKWEVLVSC